jgi:hypothetical protein
LAKCYDKPRKSYAVATEETLNPKEKELSEKNNAKQSENN